MGYEIIGIKPAEHECSRPKMPFFGKRKHLGLQVRCDCGKVWEYYLDHSWYGNGSWYGWKCINSLHFLPKVPSGPAPGAAPKD